MNKDYSYDYEYDDRYCYKQSDVLINKLDIKDSYELSVAEREITALRMMDAKINKIEGHFDFRHLCAIHRYLFGDIYEWAGKLRWVNIAKENMFYILLEKEMVELRGFSLNTLLKVLAIE